MPIVRVITRSTDINHGVHISFRREYKPYGSNIYIYIYILLTVLDMILHLSLFLALFNYRYSREKRDICSIISPLFVAETSA